MLSSCSTDAGHERPERFDLVAANVEEAGSDRRVHPLVEARAVVVGAELIARERKVRERMRAVDEHLNAVRLRQLDDLPHRRDVARLKADIFFRSPTAS